MIRDPFNGLNDEESSNTAATGEDKVISAIAAGTGEEIENIRSKIEKESKDEKDDLLKFYSDVSKPLDLQELLSYDFDMKKTEERKEDVSEVKVPEDIRIENERLDAEEADKKDTETSTTDSTPAKPKKRKLKGFVKEILWLACVMLATLITLNILRATNILRVNKVSGSSMEPTFYEGDTIVSSCLTSIDRYDVVIAEDPENGELIIKRVIGMPGDIITWKNSDVYINEKLSEDDFVNESYGIDNGTQGLVELGEDEYFLCGDNREVSKDSRYFGVVTKDEIYAEKIISW